MNGECAYVFMDDNGCVPVKVMVIGALGTNCYLIADGEGDEGCALVIDPAGGADAVIAELGGRALEYVVCTHNHFDHTGAVAELARRTGARVVASVQDSERIETGQKGSFAGIEYDIEPAAVDVKVKDGDVICLGSLKLKVIHTPGHTKGGICLYLPGNEEKFGMLFAGDTLFHGCTGRIDLEGGNGYEMRGSLRTKIAPLPNETVVYPGHGGFTTIGAERRRVIESF